MTSPLKKYFRKPVLYINIPTNGKFIDNVTEDDLSVFKEVGVLPMTTFNDLEIKNPESLLNGEIIGNLIEDCTNLQVDFKQLSRADIDSLMIAIKIATYGEFEEKTFNCGNKKCKKENTVNINLQSILNSCGEFDDEYIVTLSNQLKVYLQPTNYGDILQLDQAQLQENSTVKELEKSLREGESMTEEELEEKQHEIYAKINHLVKMMSVSAMNTIVNDIIKIETPDGKIETNKESILEFINDLSKKDYELISDKLSEINDIGVDEHVPVKCQHCESEFDLRLDLNPTSFFGESS